MQHIFTQSTYQNYTTFVELVKNTPRIWNIKQPVRTFFQHATWLYNFNLNIIQFKNTKNYFKCKTHNIECYFLVYQFQNTIVKCLNSDKPHITILTFKKKLILLNSTILSPFLINLMPSLHDCPINLDKNTVIKILKDQSVLLDFNVFLYSSYYYIKHSSHKIISNNIIGHYINKDNVNNLHLFVSPDLIGHKLHFNVINVNTKCTLPKIMTTIRHIPEGTNIKLKNNKINNELLNQEYCVCDHPTTNRVFLSAKCTQPLGIIYCKFY
jgi:hypothetical protein